MANIIVVIDTLNRMGVTLDGTHASVLAFAVAEGVPGNSMFTFDVTFGMSASEIATTIRDAAVAATGVTSDPGDTVTIFGGPVMVAS